jgi:hypothetical protein
MGGCAMGGKEITECNVAKDGVCALHGVEVERRRNAREDVETLKSKMPFLLSSINKLLAFQILLLVIMGGSYAYTRDVSQTAEFHARDAKSEFSTLTDSINNLKIVSTRADERYVAVLRELETLNRQIGAIITHATNNQQKENPKQ